MSSNTVLEARIAERDQCINAAKAMAESEDFNPEDPTFVDLQTRATELDSRVSSLAGLLEQQAAADAFDGKMAKLHQTRQQAPGQTQTTTQSLGEMFVRSEQFESYRYKGSSGVLTVDDDVLTRALPTSMANLLAAGIKGSIASVDTSAPAPPTPVLDAVTTINVSGNAIEYVAWSKIAGSAATVAEGAPKPSVEFGPVVTPATLEMIAAYTQMTRQMIEDYSAVRTQIDGELRREISREEEEHAAAALVAATIPTATGGGELLAAIRVGIATVQSAGYSPNAVMMNPADWADLDVSVMGATLLGPITRQSFWGLGVLPASSQPAGTATVGDFKAGVHRYTRSAINLFVTDSHADTFLTNVFTLLAERRSKTVVVRPAALVECTAGT